MAGKQRLVVIGNGMAGARFLEEVVGRGGGDQYELVVFGDEPYGNYNRILLSGVLAGSSSADEIYLNPMEWYARHRVTLHAGVRVTELDLAARQLAASNGLELSYDKLVLAMGSSAFVPPMEGLRGAAGELKPGAFVFRTLDDCSAMIDYARSARTAAVVGGGLLGLEAARGLLQRGLAVSVIHLMPHLMDAQLDPGAGRLLGETMQGMGVQILLERMTEAVLGDDRVTGLRFAGGEELACDMLVIAAGIRPNVELARQAGLYIRRGIVVGDDMACQDTEDVFALGECAEHRGRVYGLVAPAWEQGRVLADRLTGRDPEALYEGSKIATKLKVMGVDMAVMGDKDPTTEEDEQVNYVEAGRGIYKKLIIRDNRLVGAILLGDSSSAARLLRAFDSGEPLPADRAELLFPLAGDNGEPDVAGLPDATQVCNCNGVSKGQLVAAVQGGCRSLKALCDSTRAGTGCGSCKPMVQAILEASAEGVVEDPSIHYYVPGVPLTKPALIEAIRALNLRSVSAVFAALADGVDDPVSKPGLASLLRTLWGSDYEDERDSRFINDRVHANIQKDGTFSVVPRIYGGVVTPAELRRIAEVAEKYDVPLVKLTGGQRLDLLGVSRENLPLVWQDLGMPSGHAYTKSFRTCKTCVGSDWCRYGLGDAIGLGIQIEKRFQGIESPHKMKLGVTGCPRNCSEATTKDLGAVAIEGGQWEVLVGGAAGSRVRRGDVLCTVDSEEEVLRYMGRFMQYYRERGKYLERTYDFVERVGIEQLRSVLVDDSEGLAGALDAAIQAAVDAYVDPWQEAAEPTHPNQFLRSVTPDERQAMLADATPCVVEG